MTSGTDVVYLYEGWQCIEEREYVGTASDDPNSPYELRRRYVYGSQYIDEPVLFEKDTNANGAVDDATDVFYFYLHDANYNVVATADANGYVAERTWYEPYGTATFTDASGDTPVAASAIDNPYSFQGRRLDSIASGSDTLSLYYYRNRYYSAELGRFLQRDPAGYVDGMGLYEFGLSAPELIADPYGLGTRTVVSDKRIDDITRELIVRDYSEWKLIHEQKETKWEDGDITVSPCKILTHQGLGCCDYMIPVVRVGTEMTKGQYEMSYLEWTETWRRHDLPYWWVYDGVRAGALSGLGAIYGGVPGFLVGAFAGLTIDATTDINYYWRQEHSTTPKRDYDTIWRPLADRPIKRVYEIKRYETKGNTTCGQETIDLDKCIRDYLRSIGKSW